jgi:hypothetical protein
MNYELWRIDSSRWRNDDCCADRRRNPVNPEILRIMFKTRSERRDEPFSVDMNALRASFSR